ncbi:hypothetical protein SARC_04833 [Sphaeroforma arctica JP610]|uniref:Pentacotripeptide-repeat region of PRORP domain-containing protein n=1 Tax=Sphaeroforma arctica JP610 TaxID=667725 RepID=A0A0L0G1B4_9EUKA|nr:hypothetical protein SARC_04833 [Sphaeroforma arctica JP610]KNC82890.1 hypothetical protein SARC_04833 [Sphaeroforma arctica JP610]|eukprot:XP_014156792.1 hypothetical protein SARC_04833 [Sphaeroforma arctica JP610]
MFRSSTSPALRHTRQQPVRTYITHRKDAKYSEIGANIGLRMHKQSSLDYRSGLATTPLPLRRGYNTYHAMISESESELSSGHHDPSESRFNPNTLSTMNSTVDSDSATTAIATHQVNPDTANVISLGSNSNTNMNTSKGPGVNDIDRAVGGVNGSVREVCGWNPDGDGHATELNAPNEQKRSSWSPRGRREKDNQNPLKLNLRIHPEAKNVLGAHQSLPSFRRDVDAIFAGKGSKRKLDEDLLINALNNIRKRLAISPTYRLEEFNRLVNRMRRANVKFSKNIYTELTNVGFEIDVSGKTGFHYMTEMKKHGHAVEGEPYFYCLSHLAEKGEIKTAERILTEMEKAGTATEDCYIPIIQALVKNGREKDRINYIFERARKADVLLGVKTYTQYIAAIAENPHLGLGEIVSVWDKMSNMGLAQNSHTARTAINAAENMSDLKVVVRMAKKAHVLEDAYVQRALVYSYANLYALKDVRRMLLQTHLDNHGQPRKLADFEGTMAGVLTRLGNKGNAQAKAEATTFLYNLVREEHILVNQKFCTQMMMYFTKAQQYSKTKEVFELLKTMKGGYDTHAANAMIHQLSIEGKITDAVELMAEVSRNPNCALDQFTIAPIINAAAKTDNAPMVAMLRQLSNQHQLPRFYTSLRAEFDMHVRMENFDMLLPIIQDMRELNRPFSADVCEIMMNLNLKRNNYTGAMTWFGKAISHDAHIPSNAYHWSPEVYVEAHRAIGVALADAGILDGYAELVPNQLHGQDEEEVLVMQDFVPQPQRHEQAVRQVANRRERRSHAKRGTPLADTQKDIIHVDAPKVTEHNAAHRISPKNSQARPMAQKTEPLHAGRGVWRTNYTPMTMVARDGQKASPLVVYGDDLLAEGQTEIYHHDIHEARQIMKLYRQLKETDPENPVMSTHELEETRELSRVGRDFVTWAVEAAAVPADQRQPAPKTSTEERRNHTNSVSQNSDAVAEARADEEMLTLESATHQPVTEVLKVSSKSNNKTRVSQNTTQENVSATASMGTNGQPHAESVATKSVAAARPVAPTSTAPQPGTRGSVEDQPSAHIPDTTRSRQPEATQHVAGDRNGPEPDSRTSAVDVGTAHTALGTTGGGS